MGWQGNALKIYAHKAHDQDHNCELINTTDLLCKLYPAVNHRFKSNILSVKYDCNCIKHWPEQGVAVLLDVGFQ